MAGKVYNWFIEPKDSRTNEAIASGCSEENLVTGIECADEIKRNLWRCTPQFRDKLVASRKSLGLNFEVFCSEGKNTFNRIRNVSHLFLKKNKTKK